MLLRTTYVASLVFWQHCITNPRWYPTPCWIVDRCVNGHTTTKLGGIIKGGMPKWCIWSVWKLEVKFQYGSRLFLHLYQTTGWYKCTGLRMWFVIPYYHKIFIFAVLERWLIYDCEIECSFFLFNISIASIFWEQKYRYRIVLKIVISPNHKQQRFYRAAAMQSCS